MNISLFKNNGSRGSSDKVGRATRRAAFVRTRVLAASTVALVAGSAWWVSAQNGKVAVKKVKTASSSKPVVLAELPELVQKVGRARAYAAANAVGPKAAGVGKKRFALTEVDLTPFSPSDEREPSFSRNGQFVAFASNGADSDSDGDIDALNADGKYHIWVMNRDGSDQRQITGLTTDATNPSRDNNQDQRQPSFSPDGNQIVFAARGLEPNGPSGNTTVAGQLFVVNPFVDGNLAQAGVQPPIEQRTFFTSGEIMRPSFGGNGLSIVFAHQGNVDGDAGDTETLGTTSFDIFTVTPNNESGSLQRLTGGTFDPAGANVEDNNPTFSLGNQGAIFWTSRRTNTSGNNAARIWLMASDGSAKQQVSNPLVRTAGVATDDDDWAASSGVLGTFDERVAFQTTSKLDASDSANDLNVWSLDVSTVPTATPQPTATPVATPLPALTVNSFNNGQTKEFRTTNGAFIRDLVSTGAANKFEGITFGPDITGDGYGELYIANRVQNRIERYDGRTGANAGLDAQGQLSNATANFITGSGLFQPTDIKIRNGLLYVASGSDADLTNNAGVSESTNNIKRFSAFNGAPNGTNADFTGPGAGGITNGIEGITFDASGGLYVSALFNNKIVKFNTNGSVDTTFGTGGSATDASLSFPTGITIGPDNFIYVSSSGTDDVLRFTLAGAFSNVFVADNNGATNGLDAPEGLVFGPDGNLYVSSFNSAGGTAGSGDAVLRFSPAGAPLPSAGNPGAIFASGNQLQGPSYLTFNPSALSVVAPTPTPTTPPTPPPAIENVNNVAVVESNTLSSQNSFAASGLSGVSDSQGVALTEDTVADRESSFSAAQTTEQAAAQLIFASQRRTKFDPINVNNPQNPDGTTNTRPLVQNPSGGANGTHDIWATATQDFTDPILVPIGSGNARSPVVAPGIQSPFPAPRTYEQGLRPGQAVQIGFVISERESGLASASVAVYSADTPAFNTFTSLVNNAVPVQINQEIKPASIGTAVMTITDQGAPFEKQAGAVKGDGVFYCSGTFTAPTGPGDFYFDIRVSDNAGNFFNYDNIWGFSTRQFVKSAATSDLVVADYTQGQVFPGSTGDPRFFNMPPVTSYYLTNPVAIAGENIVGINGTQTTVTNADVWQILSRGAVPQEVLSAYAPTETRQIDPTDTTDADGNGIPDFRNRTRRLAVSSSSVFWASPYTGTVFSGPGTLFDSETQRRLTNYLQAGGRLFVSGRDVSYSLSNAGTVTNNFLRDELATAHGGEIGGGQVQNNIITAVAPGRFTNFPSNEFGGQPFNNEGLNNLQVPDRDLDLPFDPVRRDNTFLDAALNNGFIFFDGGTTGTDIINPQANGATLVEAYTISGQRVGQRIEKNNRNNGFQSRAVFFTFGFEAVNRRYERGNPNNTAYAINMRQRIANAIKSYFKTGGISGQVINDETNLPAADFLIEIIGNGTTYFTRTNTNGNFEILGLPSGTYTVRPATRNGRSLNAGFSGVFGGTPLGVNVGSPNITSFVNFRAIPVQFGSLSGVAVKSNGTFDLRTDDTALPNVRVLLRSLEPSSVFPGGGFFVRSTTTDAAGRFNFSGVPTETDLRVIFNPEQSDVPIGSGVVLEDLNPGDPALVGNPNFGRRQLPDTQRPNTVYTNPAQTFTDSIYLRDANPFILNDGDRDTPINDALEVTPAGFFVRGGPILIPVGRTINGRVFLNGDPLGNAFVELINSAGTVINTTTSSPTLGEYAFFDVLPGTYTVRATFTRFGMTITAQTQTLTVGARDLNVDTDGTLVRLLKQDVSGQVLLNGGAPGEALLVELLQGSTPVASTQTTVAGDYVFNNVAAGTYTVRATRRGVTKTSPGFVVATFDVAVADTGDKVAPTINFFNRTLTGTTRVNGVATGGIVVQLLSGGGAPFNPARTMTSDANGNFSFTEVDNGNFVLRGSTTGLNGVDIASLPVTIGSDTDVTLDFFLHTIIGRVILNNQLASAATANSRVLVELSLRGRVFATDTTDNQGEYSFDRIVAANPFTTFTLRATRIVNGAVVDRSQFVNVTVTRGASPIPDQSFTFRAPDLRLASQTLRGIVSIDDINDGAAAGPAANARVELLQGTRVLLSTVTGARGEFTLTDVGVGTFTLRATAQGDTVSRVIVVQRGRNQLDLRLTLVLQSVSGTVLVNTTPSQGTQVLLVQGARVIQSAVTNDKGAYSFSRIPAGTYQVRANRFGDNRVSNTFVVQRGRNATAPVLVLREQSISGRVTVNRAAMAGVTVQLLRGGRVVQSTTTNAAGNYRFGSLPASTYTVRATRNGESSSQTVTIQPLGTRALGTSLTVNLELLLQSISGRVLVNGTPVVGQRVDLLQGGRVLRTFTSTTGGNYIFSDLAMGTYVVRAARDGDSVQVTVTLTRTRPAVNQDLNLRFQTITGVVTLDGRPVAGANVTLTRGGVAIRPVVRTASNGTYSFTGLVQGGYVVTATLQRGVLSLSGTRTITVLRGTNLVVPAIALNPTAATPGPTPDSGDEEFQPNTSYQISVPYTDTPEPYSATTVAKAFTVPATANGVENYKIFRYDARTTSYIQLNNASPIRRGEGYFLQPQARGVSIRRPVEAGNRSADPTRLPTTVTEFEIVLRRNPSLAANARNNGFNLIGFPFNPQRFSASSWADAIVIAPDGTRYSSVRSAAAAGIVSDTLFTLGTNDDYTPVQDDLVPFRGYFARTFVDGVRIILRPGGTTTTTP